MGEMIGRSHFRGLRKSEYGLGLGEEAMQVE
jgi:hypothetical protein